MADPGSIVFGARREPGLPPGGYEVEVAHAVLNTAPVAPGGRDAIDEKHTAVQRLAVRGERFALDAGEVAATYPPAGGRGPYDDTLPHALVRRVTLPWERSATLSLPGPPWLALLLFEAGEVGPPQSILVGDLQRGAFPRDRAAAAAEPSGLPADVASYADAFAHLPATGGKPHAFALEWGERMWDPCQAIDVPVEVFGAIAPTAADLGWLAHVRGGDAPAEDLAVVVGNRVPSPGSECTVHLVSLEGMAAFLPGGDLDAPAAIATADGTAARALRLVSLASWSFSAEDRPGTFAGRLGALDAQPPTLRLPPTQPGAGGDPAVEATVALGYTALAHATRTGDRTMSWYRGPLLPAPAAAGPPSAGPSAPLPSADAALRYDPETGMLDVSLSAAWQLGRTLALASSTFSASLYGFKRAAAHRTDGAVAAGHLAPRLMAETEPGAVAALDGAHAAAAALLAGPVAAQIAPIPPEDA
ncbi:MAG TPA: hypothetical protein VGW10_15550 [Solirubrobacteraceae bacterium]|nr:hypothetical protein [Solirubrobacteraceae bacterium]